MTIPRGLVDFVGDILWGNESFFVDRDDVNAARPQFLAAVAFR
jgi:hypothetical protein